MDAIVNNTQIEQLTINSTIVYSKCTFVMNSIIIAGVSITRNDLINACFVHNQTGYVGIFFSTI